jgi:hypothetical protein
MQETTTVKELPAAALLSNGRYDVVVEASGGGHSAYDGRLLTPRLGLGTSLYVSEGGEDPYAVRMWPVASDEAGEYPTAHFGLGPGTCRLRRTTRDGARVTCDICVVPDRDAELRRYVIANASKRVRRFTLTVVTECDGSGGPAWARGAEGAGVPGIPRKGMSEAAVNSAGTAGGVVETSLIDGIGGVLAVRKQPDRPTAFLLHAFLDARPTAFETDGVAFFGAVPDAVHPPGLDEWLSGATGRPGHPVLTLQTYVSLEPGEERTLTLAGCAGTSQDRVVATAETLADRQVLADAFLEAALREQRARDHLKLGPRNADRYHRVAARVLHDDPALRMRGAPDPSAAEAAMERLGLHPLRPLAVCRISDESELYLAHLMLKARAFWQTIGLSIQVLFLNDKSGADANSLQQELHDAIEGAEGGMDGLVLRHADIVPPDEQRVVQRSAQLVLTSDGADLLRVGR